jgi:uncharacterized protein
MTQADRPILPALDEERFEAFLAARRPVPPAVSLSGFDGYVTALVIGPRFVDPRRWIPLFAGEQAMLAPVGTEDCAAVQSIVATYNRLSASMAEFPYLYRPRFLLRDEGRADGHPWVAGFFAGASHAPRLWKPMLNGLPETGNLIAPIRAAIRWRSTPEDIKDIAKAVLAIRDHFMPLRVRAARR